MHRVTLSGCHPRCGKGKEQEQRRWHMSDRSVSQSRTELVSQKEASFISGQMLPLYLQLSLHPSLLNSPQFNYTTIRAMSRVPLVRREQLAFWKSEKSQNGCGRQERRWREGWFGVTTQGI